MGDKPIPVNLPEGLEEGLDEFRRENSHIFEMRQWLQEALEAQGGVFTGGSCGGGVADIDIEFEGRTYIVTIAERKKPERAS